MQPWAHDLLDSTGVLLATLGVSAWQCLSSLDVRTGTSTMLMACAPAAHMCASPPLLITPPGSRVHWLEAEHGSQDATLMVKAAGTHTP